MKYVVYLGEKIIDNFDDIKLAEKCYDSIPSGVSKSWSKRRALVQEITILCDLR